MNLRTLGNTGTAVSDLCLGTMTFGAEADEATSHRILDAFVDAGGNFVDTADVYSAGRSEQIIGRWLARRGSADVVLATKGRFAISAGTNRDGNSRRHLRLALDASLTRLGVDHIDLYQLHAWDALTPLDETLRFLDDAITVGKIGYYGFSNFLGWQLTKAVHRAAALGLAAPVTLQPQYNLLVRDIEHEIVPAALDAGMGLLPWSPLAGGWLTGKYRRDEAPTGATRLGENPERGMEAYRARNQRARTWEVLDAVRTASERLGATDAQVSIAWLLSRPAVSSVILGARDVDQLTETLGASDVELDAEALDSLTAASAPSMDDYPYGAGGIAQRERSLTDTP